jgi:hypothetical protein
MASRRNMQQAAINIAGSGQQTIFTNPSTTQFAYVWELYMTCAAATTVQFYDGPGALTGNINVIAGTPIVLPDHGQQPRFTISPNAVFNVSEGAGTQKSGYVHFSN